MNRGATQTLRQRQRMIEAVAAMANPEADTTPEWMRQLMADARRAAAETVEIFPIRHHSPVGALHLIRRLRTQPLPRVIFLEMCEDLGLLPRTPAQMTPPVALEAVAHRPSFAFPAEWAPMRVIAPLVAFSAEWQAMAFEHQHRATVGAQATQLVFVDRSADHLFQWKLAHSPPSPPYPAKRRRGLPHHQGKASPVGAPSSEWATATVEPTVPALRSWWLQNTHGNYETWWAQAVEAPLLHADYETYRHRLFLLGSLIRRLGLTHADREASRRRERFMWSRIKTWLRIHGIAPTEALLICGAVHAVSDVREFGSASPVVWPIPPRTKTIWDYRATPFSPTTTAADDTVFRLPPGTLAQSDRFWTAGLSTLALTPFDFAADSPPPPPPPPSSPSANRLTPMGGAVVRR